MSAAAADVFLSYSRTDAPAVRQIQVYLKQAGLATFLDRDQLAAGQPWLSALEQAIARCAAVAVLVGPAGLGTWQQREVQLALDRQAEAERAGRSFPVIPILLPKVEDPPGGFLRLQTWVDLRSDLADPIQLDLLLAGLRGQAPADASTLREALCPYRGLEPFREEDAGLFFGREEAIDTLLGKLRDHNLITLVGRSGSGKSSVVSAGVIPALRRRADGRTWSIRSLRPGPEPLHALVRLFDPPPIDWPPFKADQRVEQQVAILRTDDQALGRRIRSLLATAEETGTDRLLLHVDQWEELYSQALRNPALKPELAERDITQFIDLVLEATQTSPCTVVLTVRADFYGEFLKHGPLAAAVPPGQVNLGPLSRDGLTDAIRKPAEAVGLTVDPALLETLVDEVCNDLGKLPLLEYALKETWHRREGQRLTLNAYGEAGGIDGAVAQRANQIFTSLSQAQQAAARRLFVSLVTPGEGREDTRARAVYPEQDEAIAAVINKFSAADARLLVTGEDTPSARRLVDLSHEAMIREWDLLKTWIETNREALRRREHIRARLRQWEEEDRDPTLLLPPGLPLEEGRKLLADHGDVLIDEMQPYIAASLAADEERQRQAEAAAEAERQRELAAAQRRASEQRKRARIAICVTVGALLLAGAAVWQWLVAQAQTHLANAAIQSSSESLRNALILSELSGVQRSEIGKLLTRAVTDFEQLMQEGRRSELLRYEYAWRLMALADHYRIIGEAESWWDAATKAHDLLKELVAEYPSNNEFLKQLAISYDQIGDIHAHRTKREQALREYHASRDIREKLSKDDPSNPHLRGLSISYSKIGDILFEQGNDEDALKAFEEALKKATQSLPDDPLDIESQRNLLVINHRIGDVLLAKHFDLQRARDVYDKSLSIAKKLAAHYHDNNQLQRDLSASHEKIGDLLEVQENLDGAFQAYHDSLLITQRLYDDDPEKVDIQDDLALEHENIGGILLKQGNPQAALDHYQRSLAIREQLADEDPSEDVLWSHDHIGYTFKQLDQVQAATGEYQASYVIAERLAAADPENATWQYLSYRQLGQVRELEGNAEEALKIYCRAKNVIQSALPPGKPRWQKQLDWLKERLAAVHGSGTSKC
jgi:tetratricopeptide (TPR) repeat protein